MLVGMAQDHLPLSVHSARELPGRQSVHGQTRIWRAAPDSQRALIAPCSALLQARPRTPRRRWRKIPSPPARSSRRRRAAHVALCRAALNKAPCPLCLCPAYFLHPGGGASSAIGPFAFPFFLLVYAAVASSLSFADWLFVREAAEDGEGGDWRRGGSRT